MRQLDSVSLAQQSSIPGLQSMAAFLLWRTTQRTCIGIMAKVEQLYKKGTSPPEPQHRSKREKLEQEDQVNRAILDRFLLADSLSIGTIVDNLSMASLFDYL